MTTTPNSSIQEIHSMLTVGHRNIKIRPHTLWLWGIAGAALILTIDSLISAEQFPVLQHRYIISLMIQISVLFGVGLLDHGYTKTVLEVRNESLSFTHRQIRKVWWLLICFGILFNFASGFYGSSMLALSFWMVGLGFGLYLHGLFSAVILEWIAALIILLGMAPLILPLDYAQTKILMASILGLGLPALTFILPNDAQAGFITRLRNTTLWLLLVCIPPILLR